MAEPQRSHINWAELDRLVDGQLNREEYREMLRQIDKDPDGWRQCAMAFLEHQAMEKELAAFGVSDECPAGLRSGEYVAAGNASVPGFGPLFRNVVMVLGLIVVMIGGIVAGASFPSASYNGELDNRFQPGQPGMNNAASPALPSGDEDPGRRCDGQHRRCPGTQTHKSVGEEFDEYLQGDEALQGCKRRLQIR